MGVYIKCLQMLSFEASGVWSQHQPNHSWFWFALLHSSTTTSTLCHHGSSPTPLNISATSPSPILRGLGSINNAPWCAEPTNRGPTPLPSPEGCGRAWYFPNGRVGQHGEQWKGGPKSGKPIRCVIKTRATTFVVVHRHSPADAILQSTGVMSCNKDSATQPENQQWPANEMKTQWTCGCGTATTSWTNGEQRPNSKRRPKDNE